MSNEFTVTPGGPLKGTIRVPGDKSISHRALILAAAANGSSTVTGLSNGDDVARTRAAIEKMGAVVSQNDNTLTISGGPDLLHEPDDVLDMGNSGTGMRLMAGWVAGLPWLTVFTGDASLRGRPMGRVVEPLRQMGAVIDGREGGKLAPLIVHGRTLHTIDYISPVASAQVKSAILLAGLNADGKTTVREPLLSRAHTEEMLIAAGVPVTTTEHRDGRASHTLVGGELTPFTIDVPGDPSQAAFWLVAAATVPGSDVTVENVYSGPGRGGLVDVLNRMGADIEIVHRNATTIDVRVRYSKLSATDVGAEEVPSLVDELPVLAVAAAAADGVTRIEGAGELRVKESDRIASVHRTMSALGAAIVEQPEGFEVTGSPKQLIGATIDAGLDHRIAMMAAIAGISAAKAVTIRGWDSVASSYPGFAADLEKLRS